MFARFSTLKIEDGEIYIKPINQRKYFGLWIFFIYFFTPQQIEGVGILGMVTRYMYGGV